MRIPPEISELIDRGALVAISHSGGKDSQAMTIRLIAAGIPRDQLLLVYATLDDVEWPGTIRHIEQTGFGLPLVIATPRRSFFEMVRARGMLSSGKYSTSSLPQVRSRIGPMVPACPVCPAASASCRPSPTSAAPRG